VKNHHFLPGFTKVIMVYLKQELFFPEKSLLRILSFILWRKLKCYSINIKGLRLYPLIFAVPMVDVFIMYSHLGYAICFVLQ
jgi:hypothetical protein